MGGRGGEGGEICGSVNHGKDAHRGRVEDAGAPWIFVHETRSRERERERYTPTDSHPTLFEIDNSGIRICLTNRNDLIRINRGS